MTIEIIGVVLLAYLLGSIPTAVWVGKKFYNKDIREFGSGNAGATNTFRVLGKKAGIPVLIFDVLKGWFSVYVLSHSLGLDTMTNSFMNIRIALGIAAVIGHIYPIFAKFKGGKGVATTLGVVIALDPISAFSCMGVFIVVLLISRIVSVSSMVAAISFPIFVILIYKTEYISLQVFSIVMSLLIVITHKKNIGRLIKGEESKIFGNKRN
ncbi:glycerol-3-phosphate 1-O-acyltransferase PlsY [Flavobacteriales bacterium]|nr:glycerol-3-phosphate 1-O-acyltransferase PlsY [Flavobacteriales bacterium]